MNSYRAHAFAPETGAKVHAGTIELAAGSVRFASPSLTGELPLERLSIRRGGQGDEQIFFEHPEYPGWSIYSSDPALLDDPVLGGNPHFVRLARAVAKSRKAIPLPVLLVLGLLVLFLGALMLLWTQKDRIVEFIAERIPTSWEESLGDQAFEQVRREGTLLTNSVWQANVNEIIGRLLPAVRDSGYTFKFHVLQDTNVNAFAMPGGNVVILTGLLEQAKTGEEVAGVLAHELAHVTRRHGLRNIIKSAGLLVLVQSLFGDTSGLAAVVAEGSRYLLQQKFSRDFEREADDTGWTILVAADLDPRGMTRFFETMKILAAQSGQGAMDGSLSFLATHPASQERIDWLNGKWDAMEKKSGFQWLAPWPGGPLRRGGGHGD
jgi:Zn-dependent protease with chaperone function